MIYISTRYYDNATYNLVFTVETVQYNKYQEAWNTNVAIAQTKELKVKGLKVNADGAEYNTTTKSNMFKMTHPATDQTPAQTEYRYIGDNPNNYVYFNCDSLENQSSSTCEVWRIIGVFDVDDGTGNYEQRIKLVRGSALPDKKQWDDTPELGKNEWVGSTMQTYLNDNGDYYMRSGLALNYGLKVTAKSLISDAKYYLGGAPNHSKYGTADAMYLWERSITVYIYDKDNSIRSTSWVGKVALMYPSDEYLVYANEVDAACYADPTKCYVDSFGTAEDNGIPSNGWIYNSNNLEGQYSPYNNWFISTYAFNNMDTFIVDSNGWLSGKYYAVSSCGVRPVLYLSSNVKITDGTGEQNNPYKLGL